MRASSAIQQLHQGNACVLQIETVRGLRGDNSVKGGYGSIADVACSGGDGSVSLSANLWRGRP